MDQDVKKFAAIVLPYAMLCSAISGFFYWNFVNINLFDFISLDAVLTHSVPSIIMSALMIVPVWLLGFWTPQKDRFPTEAKERTIFFQTVAFFSIALNAIAIVVASSPIAYRYPGIFVFLTCALFPCAVKLSRAPLITGFFSSQAPALAVTLILACLPSAMLWSAAERASQILSGNEYNYIEATNLKDISGFSSAQRLVYYGKLGDFLFFRINDSIIAFSSDSFTYLEFKHQGKLIATPETKK